MSGLNSPVTTPNPKIGQLLQGNINSVYTRHWKQQFSTAQTTFSSTYNLITKAPCKNYDYVRVILKNGEATPPGVLGVLLAPTASDTDLTVPTVGNTLTGDSTTGWTQVTFNGANTPTLAVGSATNPSFQYSDWMRIKSITPTTGSSYPYVMARIKMTANYSAIFTGTQNNDNTKDTYLQVTGQVVDGITTPSNMTSNTLQSFSPIFGLEFMSSNLTAKVLCVGASVTQGIQSTPTDSGYNGWVSRTQTLLGAAGYPVCMINGGFSGQTTTQFAIHGKNNVAAMQPAIVIYNVYTSNDGVPTQTLMDTQFARAVDFANFALRNGAIPVFEFGCPVNSLTLSQDNLRKALIARCKTIGTLCLDTTSLIGDTASPQQFLPAYSAGDGVHPNDAGYDVMATATANFIETLLDRNINLI